MATQTYFFRGKFKWALVHSMDAKYSNYKVNLYMDDASKELYATSGLQMQPKKEVEGVDKDGKPNRAIDCDIFDADAFVVFRRAHSKEIKGDTVTFGKPKVLDADGAVTTDLIGNDSTGTIKVVAFDTMNGIGHRLEAVKVETLVPYEGKAGETHVPEGFENDCPF